MNYLVRAKDFYSLTHYNRKQINKDSTKFGSWSLPFHVKDNSNCHRLWVWSAIEDSAILMTKVFEWKYTIYLWFCQKFHLFNLEIGDKVVENYHIWIFLDFFHLHRSEFQDWMTVVSDVAVKCLPIRIHLKFMIEPRQDKKCLREFSTRPDTNRPAQPQKLARVLKFRL